MREDILSLRIWLITVLLTCAVYALFFLPDPGSDVFDQMSDIIPGYVVMVFLWLYAVIPTLPFLVVILFLLKGARKFPYSFVTTAWCLWGLLAGLIAVAWYVFGPRIVGVSPVADRDIHRLVLISIFSLSTACLLSLRGLKKYISSGKSEPMSNNN